GVVAADVAGDRVGRLLIDDLDAVLRVAADDVVAHGRVVAGVADDHAARRARGRRRGRSGAVAPDVVRLNEVVPDADGPRGVPVVDLHAPGEVPVDGVRADDVVAAVAVDAVVVGRVRAVVVDVAAVDGVAVAADEDALAPGAVDLAVLDGHVVRVVADPDGLTGIVLIGDVQVIEHDVGAEHAHGVEIGAVRRRLDEERALAGERREGDRRRRGSRDADRDLTRVGAATQIGDVARLHLRGGGADGLPRRGAAAGGRVTARRRQVVRLSRGEVQLKA